MAAGQQGQPLDFGSVITGPSGPVTVPALYPDTPGLPQSASEPLTLLGLDLAGASVAIYQGDGAPVGLPVLSSVLYTAGVAPALDELLLDLDTSGASGNFAVAVSSPSGHRAIARFSVIPV